jgi:hypothetical protein
MFGWYYRGQGMSIQNRRKTDKQIDRSPKRSHFFPQNRHIISYILLGIYLSVYLSKEIYIYRIKEKFQRQIESKL